MFPLKRFLNKRCTVHT